MVKQRMATADVAAEAACLRARCLGMRVANVYDINSKVRARPLSHPPRATRPHISAWSVPATPASGQRFSRQQR